MSSKFTSAPEMTGAEDFVYPEAAAAPGSDANAAPDSRPLWGHKTENKVVADGRLAAEREQSAWNKGREEGLGEARTAAQLDADKLRTEVANAVREFAAERDVYFQRVEEQLVRLALSIARKILHREAQVDPLLLAGVLRVALEKLGATSGTRLRANPADIAVWRAHFADAGEDFPVPDLAGDPEMQPGRCILETELGTTEIGLETQLKEIEQGFLDLLAQRPGSR